MRIRDTQVIHQLFLLNICLQLFDGVATYYGIVSPEGEGNPIVAAAMTQLGIGSALLLFKAKACGCLLVVRRLASQRVAGGALAAVAGTYAVFSFLPWMSRILQML